MNFRCLRRSLKNAIDSNDIKVVQEIIEKFKKLPLIHPDSNNLRRLLESVWRFSIYCKHEEISKILASFLDEFFKFTAQADLNQYLNLAVQNGNVQITKLLLQKGAKTEGLQWNDINKVAERVFSRKNIHTRKEILILLLDYDLNAEMTNSDGQNLLHQFVQNFVEKDDHDAVEMAEELIISGASVHEIDKHENTPITYAVMKKNRALVKLIALYTDTYTEKDDLFLMQFLRIFIQIILRKMDGLYCMQRVIFIIKMLLVCYYRKELKLIY